MNINDAFSFLDTLKKRPVQAVLAVIVLCAVVAAISFSNEIGGSLANWRTANSTSPESRTVSFFADNFTNNANLTLDKFNKETFESFARAARDGDLIGFLNRIDPRHFRGQLFEIGDFGREAGDWDIGAALEQYVCEFLTMCHIGESRTFSDLKALQFLSIDRRPEDALITVRVLLTFTSGETATTEIYYDPGILRFSADVG